MTGLKAIKTVYGDTVYVREADLARCKHQIPLYHKTGESYSDRIQRTGRGRGSATTLAVENIAAVAPS